MMLLAWASYVNLRVAERALVISRLRCTNPMIENEIRVGRLKLVFADQLNPRRRRSEPARGPTVERSHDLNPICSAGEPVRN